MTVELLILDFVEQVGPVTSNEVAHLLLDGGAPHELAAGRALAVIWTDRLCEQGKLTPRPTPSGPPSYALTRLGKRTLAELRQPEE